MEQADAKKTDYKKSLNLPDTAFAMKADLTKNEPARLKKWQDSKLYDRILESHAADPLFVLHDGPPFANGDIHIGHVINKTLKDIVLRFKTMSGRRAPYVPGWDCHGLPIEQKIQDELGPKYRDMSTADLRQKCFDYAQGFVQKQSVQFQRMGILGDWENPYRTMAPAYEARVLEVFARFVEKGLVYKQLKPVQWSIENQTALADADLEYKDVVDTSVFVAFPVANPGAFKTKFDIRVNAKCAFLIWTTTPWTLPANLAIAANKTVNYSFVRYDQNEQSVVVVVASELVEKVFSKQKDISFQVLGTTTGAELEGIEYTHPFIERTGKLVTADYVTTTDGTGLVHTAPGHGEEDYATGRANGLEVYCPVLANGRYDSSVPNWLAGLRVWEANALIIEKLSELGYLFAKEAYPHSYPHDSRSKKPTIYRATEQWFIKVGQGEGSLRERALNAAKNDITFYPEWGRARLTGMLESRPDWCVSRQRAWGLPIPVFYNQQGTPLLTPESVRAVAASFAQHGSNAWFTLSPEKLLGDYDPGTEFPKNELRKEKDIFDVWFESGSSWHAVVDARSDLSGELSQGDQHRQADLYLEGSDQHRGWFQLSLLSGLGGSGEAPYKAVLTHGFAVKPDGTKVSKSDKEYVKAVEEIERHGADLLRLWVSSVDYQTDMPISPKALQEFGDKYRKIRNTIRYLLSNVNDFDPATNNASIEAFSLDAWMLRELYVLYEGVYRAYDEYKFHVAFRLIHDFCNVQISAIYGSAMKDRLYCDSRNSPARRRTQTVMYECAVTLIKLIAPVCVFTADEAWEHLPANRESADSVHLTRLAEPIMPEFKKNVVIAFDELLKLRDQALLQLDALKKSAALNKAGEAEVIYVVKDQETKLELSRFGADLEDACGCGFHSIEVDASASETSVRIIDRRGDYTLCARSWKRRPDVGSDPDYADLSARDALVVRVSSTDA